MEWSRVAPVLVAAFAVLILGVAAGSLDATTQDAFEGGSAPLSDGGGSGGGVGNSDGASSSDQTVDHALFSDLNVRSDPGGQPSRSDGVSAIVSLGVGLLLVGIAIVAFFLTGDDDQATSNPNPESESSESVRCRPTTSVGNVPPSNDVYRAWRTMVGFLRPSATAGETPTELARTAMDAGLPAEPVDELTELFCAIRYGRTPPSNDKGEHARRALERIERSARPEQSADSSPDEATREESEIPSSDSET